MKDVKQIKIFISCPGDIIEELDTIRLVVEGINKTIGRQKDYVLELLNWKVDTYTQIGSDVQDVINTQIDSKYDILVGIIWLRLGTPTERDKSGTVEEINRALKNLNKEQLVYFKTEPPSDITKIDIEELKKINEFKESLTQRGVLYHDFTSTSKFESLFRIQLTNLIYEKVLSNNKTEKIGNNEIKEIEVDKYSHIVSLIQEVENIDEKGIELDIFKSVEEAQSNLKLVTESLNTISDIMTDWTDTLNSRTTEINKTNKIKDNRLRNSKHKTLFNLMANELTNFNDRLSNEIPIYSKYLRKVGSSYSDVILIAKKYNSEEVENIHELGAKLRNSSEDSLESLAELLKSTMELPPLNFKFNKAKREAELTIKNLTMETLEGIRLLNEALKN